MALFTGSEFSVRGRGLVGFATLILAAVTMQGCAHISVDEDGTRHVVGLVSLTLPPVDAQGNAAEGFRTRSFGVTMTRSEIESGLVVGYSDLTLAFIRDDRVVAGSALRLEERFNENAPLRSAP